MGVNSTKTSAKTVSQRMHERGQQEVAQNRKDTQKEAVQKFIKTLDADVAKSRLGQSSSDGAQKANVTKQAATFSPSGSSQPGTGAGTTASAAAANANRAPQADSGQQIAQQNFIEARDNARGLKELAQVRPASKSDVVKLAEPAVKGQQVDIGTKKQLGEQDYLRHLIRGDKKAPADKGDEIRKRPEVSEKSNADEKSNTNEGRADKPAERGEGKPTPKDTPQKMPAMESAAAPFAAKPALDAAPGKLDRASDEVPGRISDKSKKPERGDSKAAKGANGAVPGKMAKAGVRKDVDVGAGGLAGGGAGELVSPSGESAAGAVSPSGGRGEVQVAEKAVFFSEFEPAAVELHHKALAYGKMVASVPDINDGTVDNSGRPASIKERIVGDNEDMKNQLKEKICHFLKGVYGGICG